MSVWASFLQILTLQWWDTPDCLDVDRDVAEADLNTLVERLANAPGDSQQAGRSITYVVGIAADGRSTANGTRT